MGPGSKFKVLILFKSWKTRFTEAKNIKISQNNAFMLPILLKNYRENKGMDQSIFEHFHFWQFYSKGQNAILSKFQIIALVLKFYNYVGFSIR